MVIVVWDGNVFRYKYVDPCSDAGLAFLNEGRTRVPCKYHTVGSVGDAVIWLCDNVVKELGGGI